MANDPLKIPRYSGSGDPYFVDGCDRETRSLVGQTPHRAVDDVSTLTHDLPNGQGRVGRIYANGLELSFPVGENSALIWAAPIALLFFSVGFLYIGCLLLFGANEVFFSFFGFFPMALFAALLAWMFARVILWGPGDHSILFNRATRRVTALKKTLPRFWQLRDRPDGEVVTFDWDAIHVRTNRIFSVGTNIASASHMMSLWVGRKDNPKILQHAIALGPANLDDNTFFRLWEHVRRYMEENGPPILEGDELSPNKDLPSPLPQEAIDAAGGRALSEEEIAKLAGPGY